MSPAHATGAPSGPPPAPSPRQSAVIAHVRTSPDHLEVQACAGSGKTTLLCMVAAELPPSASNCALAFNKTIADEMGRRLPPHVQASTMHSAGFRAVRRLHPGIRVEGRKSRRVAQSLPDVTRLPRHQQQAVVGDLLDLTPQVHNLLLDPADLTVVRAAMDRAGKELAAADQSLPLLAGMIKAMSEDNTELTFDEMLYRPATDHRYPVAPFHNTLCDESQDLNPVQHALLDRIVARGERGRLVFVGDSAQAIYAFRGAYSDSMERLRTAWGAATLPLDVCFRCPASVVAAARTVLGDRRDLIHHAPGAAEGAVICRPYGRQEWAQTWAEWEGGDMVLSRYNAPLATLAFRLLRERRACVIRGRDLGAGLVRWVESLKADTVEDLLSLARAATEAEVARLTRAEADENIIAQRWDRLETLVALAMGCATVGDLLRVLADLFTDDCPAGKILLSTVHKAKGLEAERVTWVGPDAPPTGLEGQEANLAYVAVTRARERLVLQGWPRKEPLPL